VFVQCDNEDSSYLAAFDQVTGDEVWRIARQENSNWCTPYVWKNKQRTELVTAGGTKIRSYDPRDGTLLWEMSASGRCSATPVSNEEMLYVGSVSRTTGSSGVLAAIAPGAMGDISLQAQQTSNASVIWSLSRDAPQLASALLYQGCLYVLKQHGGVVSCYDAQTGQRHYRQRLPRAGAFTASPWANDGKVFCMDEDGLTTVLQAGPEFRVLGSNQLRGMFWSSAAVVENRLLLRGVDHLYCIAES
jgi:outer membrane protein assembly factor BamB